MKDKARSRHFQISEKNAGKVVLIVAIVGGVLSTLFFLARTNLGQLICKSIYEKAFFEKIKDFHKMVQEDGFAFIIVFFKRHEIETIIITFLLYVSIAVGVLIIRSLYERLSVEFFTSIVAILAAVTLSGEILLKVTNYFEGKFESIWQLLGLAISLISFGYVWVRFVGFYPMYTHPLKELLRKNLLYRESSGSSSLHYGNYYHVDVLKVDYIPQRIERLHGSDTEDMYKVIKRFLSHRWRSNKNPSRFVLVGGFGSGKTSALQVTTGKKLCHSFFHNGRIPVYVNLREWLKDNSFLAESSIIEKDPAEITKSTNYIETLFHLVTGAQKKDNGNDPLWDVFVKLHDDRRLIYVFDGLNELLQRNADDNENINQQNARSIAAFLYRIANGNCCIVSMCELPNVITTRSICIDDEYQYEIYAVKGVHLKKKDAAELLVKKWLAKLIPYVALYRLAKASLDEDRESGPQSTYDLLSKYVDDQLKRELISPDDLPECYAAINRAIKYSATGQPATGQPATEHSAPLTKNAEFLNVFFHSPYFGLRVQQQTDEKWFQHLCDAHLFYIDIQKGPDGKEYAKYHASHILYHEFFLAKYALEKFFNNIENEEISFTSFFCGEKKTTESKSDNNPNLLEHPYLRAVFSMFLTKAIIEDKLIDAYLDEVYDWIDNPDLSDDASKDDASKYDPSEYHKNFLVLLSQINDDVFDLTSDYKKTIDFTHNHLSKLKEKTEELIKKESRLDISNRFALVKLLPDNDDRKKRLEELTTEVLKKEWPYLFVKREILLFCNRRNSK